MFFNGLEFVIMESIGFWWWTILVSLAGVAIGAWIEALIVRPKQGTEIEG